MFCRFCGKEAQDGQSFCPYCGKRDEAPIKNEAPVFVPPMQAHPVQPVPVYEPQMNQPEPTQKKKKSKLPIILVAVILVAAIVAGVVFVPGLLNKDKGEGENYDNNTVTEDGKETVWVLSKATANDGEDSCTEEILYDEYGNTIEWNEYINGQIESKKTYEYDENGNCIKESTYYDKWDTPYFILEYKYDSNNNLIETTRYVDGKKDGIATYEYDDKGNCTKIADDSGFDVSYEYDSNNNCIKEIEQDGSYTSYEYDNNGNCIKEARLYSYTTYEYDDNNNCVKVTKYYDGEESWSIVSEYDSNNNCIAQIGYEDGEEVDRCFYEYDDNNNLIYSSNRDISFEYISLRVYPERVEKIDEGQRWFLESFIS